MGEPGGELLHLADGVSGTEGFEHLLSVDDLAAGDECGGARGFGCLFQCDLIYQHLEVGADDPVAVLIGGDVVAADAGCLLRRGVLRDLAKIH